MEGHRPRPAPCRAPYGLVAGLELPRPRSDRSRVEEGILGHHVDLGAAHILDNLGAALGARIDVLTDMGRAKHAGTSRELDVARHSAGGQRCARVGHSKRKGVLRDRVERDRADRPARVARTAHQLGRLQIRVNQDHGVSRLRPVDLIQHGRRDRRRQIRIARAVDVGDQHAILDDVHPLMREAQHIAVIHAEFKVDQAHTVAGRCGAGIG